MQICPPLNPARTRPSRIPRRIALLSLAAASFLATACAQTLARPGWAGSGITPETWWRHAVVYRIDTTQLPTLTQLPSLQAFGIDAILLTPQAMKPAPAPVEAPASASTPDPTAEPATPPETPLTLDDLLFECSRLHIRVFVPLDLAAPNANPADTLALARSWLYRGAAGFLVLGIDKLTAPPPAANATAPGTAPTTPGPVHLHHRSTAIHLTPTTPEPQILTDLRKLLTLSPGEHILIGAPGAALTPTLQLQIAPLKPDTTQLAALSTQTAPHPLLALDAAPSLTPIDVTQLLATDQPAILDSSVLPADLLSRVFPPLAKGTVPETPTPAAAPPPPPPSDVYGAYKPYVRKDTNTAAERKRKAAAEKAQQDAAQIASDTFPVQPMYQPITETPEGYVAFYHRLIQLHRANPTLHDGTLHALDTGGPALAWAATHAGSAPLVVVCNPSDAPLKLDLSSGLHKLGNDRNMARTLLHTAAASGVVNVSMITVPAHGVYVGELERGYAYR